MGGKKEGCTLLASGPQEQPLCQVLWPDRQCSSVPPFVYFSVPGQNGSSLTLKHVASPLIPLVYLRLGSSSCSLSFPSSGGSPGFPGVHVCTHACVCVRAQVRMFV